MARDEDQSWIAEGARVALFTTGGASGTTVATAKVGRLTDAQIILAGGRRFRRRDLKEVGESLHSGYGPKTILRPLDDPEVRRVLARQRLRRLASDITVQAYALPASASVSEAVELLDQIEQQVVGVRQAVAALVNHAEWAAQIARGRKER